MKRAGVEQALDALAHGEFAAVMLAFDIVGAAHRFREFDAAADFLDFLFPRHAILLTDEVPHPLNHADIECETRGGFHASFGWGDPCTQY